MEHRNTTTDRPPINQPVGDGTGYLIVRVSTANGAIPIENALVTIRDDSVEPSLERGNILSVLTSDRDGNTQRIGLPTPLRATSLSPENGVPYKTYQIDVQANGYYPQYYLQVPLYDTVTSIQPAVLTPRLDSAYPDEDPRVDNVITEGSNPALRQR